MARSTNLCKQTLLPMLNVLQKSLDNTTFQFKFSLRYLRGPRSYKGFFSEDQKYQHFLRTPNPNTKLFEKVASSIDTCISASNQERCIQEEHILRSSDIDITVDNQFERLEDKVVPLKNTPYLMQLKKKYKNIRVLLRGLGRRLVTLKVPLAMGVEGLPCPIELVIPSPILEAYRNNDEFSIGRGTDGNVKTVGFYLASMKDNPDSVCISPDELNIIKKSHKYFINDFQNYIRLSPLPPCSKNNEGYWKSVTVRSNTEGDLMGIIVMHPQEMSDEELCTEKEKIKKYFLSASASRYKLKSLYFQACSHIQSEQSHYELLLGEPNIIEILNNLKFQISPESFFLVNTQASECVYNFLLKSLKIKKTATVIDICCGTGPMSILFSPYVRKCIGVDSCLQAVTDARANAEINKRQNVEFIHGQINEVLRNILSEDYYDDLVVVINPSRDTLGKSVINVLRECRYLKKVIYVSRSPQASFENFVQLCRPSGPHQYLGKAFLPILATPFDFYPQTALCGLIMMFQRL